MTTYTPTGEIDGTIYLVSGDAQKQVGNVQIQLINEKQEVLQEIKSEYDGFYLIQLVPQGEYTLKVNPDQLKRLGLKTPEPVKVVIQGEETLQSGIDIQLELVNPPKKKTKKAKPEKTIEDKAKPGAIKPEPKKSTGDKPADTKKPVAPEPPAKIPEDKKPSDTQPDSGKYLKIKM